MASTTIFAVVRKGDPSDFRPGHPRNKPVLGYEPLRGSTEPELGAELLCVCDLPLRRELSVEEVSLALEEDLALAVRGVDVDPLDGVLELGRAVPYADVVGQIVEAPLAGGVPAGPSVVGLLAGQLLRVPVDHEHACVLLRMEAYRSGGYESGHAATRDYHVVVSC